MILEDILGVITPKQELEIRATKSKRKIQAKTKYKGKITDLNSYQALAIDAKKEVFGIATVSDVLWIYILE